MITPTDGQKETAANILHRGKFKKEHKVSLKNVKAGVKQPEAQFDQYMAAELQYLSDMKGPSPEFPYG